MRRPSCVLVVLAGLAGLAAAAHPGCGGAGAPARGPAVVEDGDPDEAAEQATALIQEVYGAIRRGDPSGLLPLLAADLHVVGPGGHDLLEGRGRVARALNDAFGGKKHKVTSRGLVVVPAANGRSAWVVDTVEIDRAAYAISVLVAEVDEVWVAVAAHVGALTADKALRKALAAGELPYPQALAPPPGAELEDVMALVLEGLADPAAFLEQLAEADDAVTVGRSPKETSRGYKAIQRVWNKRIKKGLSFQGRSARAVRTPDGAVVWVIAVISTDEGAQLPGRASFVYEQLDGDWRLRVLHEAAAPPQK